MTTKQAAKILLRLMEIRRHDLEDVTELRPHIGTEPGGMASPWTIRFYRKLAKEYMREIPALKIAVYALAGVHSKGCKACSARLRCVESVLK